MTKTNIAIFFIALGLWLSPIDLLPGLPFDDFVYAIACMMTGTRWAIER